MGVRAYEFIDARKHRYEKISIRESFNLTGNPIITLENNGKIFNFILDTGSTISVIDNSVLNELDYTKGTKCINNVGIEGKQDTLQSITLKLKGRKTIYEDEFFIRDISEALKYLKDNTGVTVHGLIGTPFLNKYKYVLDFEELVIYSKK